MAFSLGAAFGKIVIDFSAIAAGIDKASKQLTTFEATAKRFGGGLSRMGGDLTRNLSLPIAGVGVAAGKMAVDFEASMNNIVALVGESREQVGSWSKDILKMGPELGRSPKELADALYFITSSGISGSAAMDTLTASAKAAAAGLGSTEVIADAVTSALNAYGTENLKAADATGILVATVKQGKGEADQIAGALGQVIPVASQMGVSFDQVGASIASMTLVGFSASEAATNLSSIMSAMVKPTNEANDTLAEYGLSAQGVRDSIRNKGLLPTLEMLKQTFGDNDEAIGKVFGNVRAFRGVLTLTGENAETVNRIFKDLAGTTGETLDQAFEDASTTAKFKLEQSMAGVQSALINLGNAVLPVVIPLVQQLSGAIASVAEWFSNLDPSMQQTIVKIAGLVAAVGPLLVIVGKTMSAFGSLASMLTGGYSLAVKVASGAMTGLQTVISTVSTGQLMVLAAGLALIVGWLGKVSEASQASNEKLVEMSHSSDLLARSAASFEVLTNGSQRVAAAFAENQTRMKQAVMDGRMTVEEYNEALRGTAKNAAEGMMALGDYRGGVEVMEQAAKELTQAEVDELRASRELVKTWDDADRQAKGLAQVQRDLANSADGAGEALSAEAQAARDFAAAQEEAQRGAERAKATLEQLTFLISGPVGKAQKEYSAQQVDARTEMAAVRAEIEKLEAAQGRAITTTQKQSMSAETLAYKSGLLADKTAKLAGMEDQSSLAALKLGSEISKLKGQVEGASGAMDASNVSYVDNSAKIDELKGKYGELSGALEANRLAFVEHMKTVLFGIAQEQLAANGLTEDEALALVGLAEQWGMIDEATAEASRGVLSATSQLAQDGNVAAFEANMGRALDTATGKMTDAEEQAYITGDAFAGMGAKTVEKTLPAMEDLVDRFDNYNKKAFTAVTATSEFGAHADEAGEKAETLGGRFNVLGGQAAGAATLIGGVRSGLDGLPTDKTITITTIMRTYLEQVTRSSRNEDEERRAASQGVPGFAHGLDMVVPPGHPNDSYSFMARLESGERMLIVPKGKDLPDDLAGGSSTQYVDNSVTNVNDALAARMLLDQKRLRRLSIVEGRM